MRGETQSRPEGKQANDAWHVNLGPSLVDIAPYINDARKMTLLGLLNMDIHYSRDALLAGRMVMALSLWLRRGSPSGGP